MLRDYSTGVKEDVKVFSGKEIEHTPAYGLQTLFLARNDLTYEQIKDLCVMVDAEAVYYGANRTFLNNVANQPLQINRLLNDGYYVTMDTKMCFKIDDVDFNKTNKGVWTMGMEDFKSKAGFTKWEQYKQDQPIKENQIWPVKATV